MMFRPASRVLVTGCAGFIGSHLSERLVELGHEVVGVDCFAPYYARKNKERNLARLRDEGHFSLHELDLSRDPLDRAFEGVEIVYHLAAQAGVRGSFGESFQEYVRHNVIATQRLFEWASGVELRALVYASSSSVYGDTPVYPTAETGARRPVSPYGMTKVAAEELAGVYLRCFGVPAVALRYFTAYGPRQRPDMAFSRFFRCALSGLPLPVHGDGRQVRDFTYIGDVVEGTIAAAALGRPGVAYNIGGGSPVELVEAIRMIAELTGRQIELSRRPAPVGEACRTGSDGALAGRDLAFTPRTKLEDGLAAQFEWTVAERQAELQLVAA
jgi:nucleoside-diphosphate-sugar epimerase